MDRRTLLTTALGIAMAGFGQQVGAQSDDYPNRTISFICPFPAGGGTDVLVRLLAADLQDKLKRSVIVENRPCAGTLIAAGSVAKAPPDGYTLLLAPVSTLAIAPATYKKLPYDPMKDFAPIGLVGSAHFALLANPQLGVSTLPELIKLIKSKNGGLSYGSSGIGTPHHLLMEMFLKMIDAKAQHVPYRGTAPALTDLISGQVSLMMADLSASLGAIRDGKLKIYGVLAPQRLKSLPNAPTIAEAGLPGFTAAAWFSVVAPAGTPQPIVDKLNKVMTTYLGSTDARDRLNALAITPITSTPEELKALIPSEIIKWSMAAKDAGIEPQ